MKFTLEQNAADSLRRSISYFSENTQTGLKAAVKELISALELYMKLQISRLEPDPAKPVLVFEKFSVTIEGEPPQYILHPSGKATVTFDQALERLAWLKHKVGSADENQIRSLKKIRNAIEHFELDEKMESVQRIYASVLDFVHRYLAVYLNLSFVDLVDGDDWRKAMQIYPTLKVSVETSAKSIYQNLVEAEQRAVGVSCCAKCGADSMVGNGSCDYRCVVCGFVHDVESCYNCKGLFFRELLHPAEGDTEYCDTCNDKVFN